VNGLGEGAVALKTPRREVLWTSTKNLGPKRIDSTTLAAEARPELVDLN